MKKTEIEIPDGKRAEWVNNVLTLVDDKPKKIDYKFNVGDVVKGENGQTYIIAGLSEVNGKPAYTLSCDVGETFSEEGWLTLVPKDITDRIKTFDDAVEWCVANGKKEMIEVCAFIHNNLSNMEGEIDEEDKDIIAYLKLRIITCALNEGWEPTFVKNEKRFYPYYCIGLIGYAVDMNISTFSFPAKLCFKSEELAKYAFNQFRDIYADFCGTEKGDEK